MRQGNPCGPRLGTFNATGDEIHAINTIQDIWVEAFLPIGCSTGLPFGHGIKNTRVNVGECFKESFRMAGRKAGTGLGGVAQVRTTGPGVNLMGLTVFANDHFVGLFLMPFQRAERSIHLNP